MSHLESLERKLREMSENGDTMFSDDSASASNTGSNSNSTSQGNQQGMCDLKVPRKFLHVMGYDGRCNDVIYCKPLSPSTDDEEISVDTDVNMASEEPRQKCVVFFGGDMQVRNAHKIK